MVPAPVERSELPGHRQRSQIPQHRQWWRSPSLAQRCGAAARKDQRNLAASTMLAVVTRAREAAPIPARSEADRPAPAGSAALRLLADVAISFSRNCCWQLQRRTMALGRSAPMLTSASPGRGGGAGAGAGRAQPATGSSPTIANSAAPTVVALSLARSALRSCGSERSAEFGSVNHAGCGHARARGGADSSALGGRPTCSGRLGGAAAAGRRRHFFLAELLLADSGADAGARAIGADADGGFAGSGRRRWCRRRSSAASYRVIANDRKFRSTDSGGALPRSLSAAAARIGKISGIWQRQPCWLWSRARARRRRFQRARRQTDLLGPAGRRCGCRPTSTFLFSGIVVGRFGSGRWSSGDRRRC